MTTIEKSDLLCEIRQRKVRMRERIREMSPTDGEPACGMYNAAQARHHELTTLEQFIEGIAGEGA